MSMFAYGRCWSCARLFTFNPDRVPSIPIDPATDLPADLGGDIKRVVREPVCADCVERANVERERNGRPLIEVLPGAYESSDDFG